MLIISASFLLLNFVNYISFEILYNILYNSIIIYFMYISIIVVDLWNTYLNYFVYRNRSVVYFFKFFYETILTYFINLITCLIQNFFLSLAYSLWFLENVIFCSHSHLNEDKARKIREERKKW